MSISEDFDLGDFGIIAPPPPPAPSGKDEKIDPSPKPIMPPKGKKRKTDEEGEVNVPPKKKARNTEKVATFQELRAKEKFLFISLREFYRGTDYIERIVVGLVDELDDDISIRLINGLVTTFTESKGARFQLGSPDNPIAFDLKSSYSRELKEWKKILFDPFRRHTRILWPVNDHAAETGGGLFFKTTLCQLNFFRWLLQFRILDFSRRHKEEIENVIQQSKPDTSTKKNNDKKKPKANEPKVKKSTRQRKRLAVFATYRLCYLPIQQKLQMRPAA